MDTPNPSNNTVQQEWSYLKFPKSTIPTTTPPAASMQQHQFQYYQYERPSAPTPPYSQYQRPSAPTPPYSQYQRPPAPTPPYTRSFTYSYTPSATPSRSLSPCPSLSPPYHHQQPRPTSMPEIVEMPSDFTPDSGAFLHGEFEDAPSPAPSPAPSLSSPPLEHYQQESVLLRGLQRLWQSSHGVAAVDMPRKLKRAYAESTDGDEDESDDEGEAMTDSCSGGRIRRRKLAPSGNGGAVQRDADGDEWMCGEMEL